MSIHITLSPASPLCLLQDLLCLCAYQRLNSENGIQEEHAVCLNQLSLILKSAGENGKTLSERRINNAVLKKLIGLTLFLFAKIITDPKKKKKKKKKHAIHSGTYMKNTVKGSLPAHPVGSILTHDLGVVLPCLRRNIPVERPYTLSSGELQFVSSRGLRGFLTYSMLTCLLLSPYRYLHIYFPLGNCVFQDAFSVFNIYPASHTSRAIFCFFLNLLSLNSFLAVITYRTESGASKD